MLQIIIDDLFREDAETTDGNDNDNDEEEEVPMLHLASFALHKLFSEWQSEGFEIPDFKIGGTTSPNEPMVVDKVATTPGVPPKRTTLPDNANDMHPTTLLCMVSHILYYYYHNCYMIMSCTFCSWVSIRKTAFKLLFFLITDASIYKIH